MQDTVQASPDAIDVAEIFAVVKRKFVKLVLLSALVGLATFAILTKMTPKYSATAQLQFGGRAVVSQAGGGAGANNGGNVLLKVDREAVASQVAVIKSRDLALKLIDELQLRKNREFNTALAGGSLLSRLLQSLGLAGSEALISDEDRVLTQYDKALKVYHGKNTRVITIQFSSTDPKLAARAANRLAELYLASRITRSVKQSVDTSTYLKPEINKLQRQVQLAEAMVEDYRGRYNLFSAGRAAQSGTLNNEQLSELTRELTRAQTQQSEADARARTIRELMARGSADASPDVMRSPLIQRLQDQRVRVERQLSELSATLLPAHPRMRQLRADLRGLKRQLRGEVAKISDSLAKEALVATRRVKSIRKSIETLKNQVRNSGGKRAKLAELERDAKAKRQQLESLLARYQNALARQRSSAVPLEAELFSRARASTIPSLKRGSIAALATAGTFILGLAFIITRELFSGARTSGHQMVNHGRRTSDRRRRASGEGRLELQDVTPASAAMAQARRAAANVRDKVRAGGQAADGGNAKPSSGTGNGYATFTSTRAVVAHIKGRARGRLGYRTLLVAGGDAKPSSEHYAMQLVQKLGAGGSDVILVDWCVTGNGLASHLKTSSRPGMQELVRGTASFEDVIKRLAGSQVHFIASGANVKDDAEDIDPDRLNLILDALDEAYDYVVLYARPDAARDLFEMLEGRFDTGIEIVGPDGDDGAREAAVDNNERFLGFTVGDLDIIRFTAAGLTERAYSGTRSAMARREPRLQRSV